MEKSTPQKKKYDVLVKRERKEKMKIKRKKGEKIEKDINNDHSYRNLFI